MKIWLEVQPPYPKQKGRCTLCICKKRKLVDEETTLMKRKKEEEIKCINTLNKDALKKNVHQSRRNTEFLPPRESKLLQKTVLEKQKILKDLDDSITKMEQ